MTLISEYSAHVMALSVQGVTNPSVAAPALTPTTPCCMLKVIDPVHTRVPGSVACLRQGHLTGKQGSRGKVQGQTAPHSAPNSQRASIQWTSSGTRTTESNRIHERSLHWTNANHGRRHVQGDHPALTPTPGSGCYSAGKSTGISTWFTQATGLS